MPRPSGIAAVIRLRQSRSENGIPMIGDTFEAKITGLAIAYD
jgi:hypothetical protein